MIITPITDLMIPVKNFLWDTQIFFPAQNRFAEHQFHVFVYFFLNLVQNVKKLNFYKSKYVSKATALHTFYKETSKSKILGNNLMLDDL